MNFKAPLKMTRGEIKKFVLMNKSREQWVGVISADRSNKRLLLAIPRSIKVVCKGFISSNICY